jgi:hypothetical protein
MGDRRLALALLETGEGTGCDATVHAQATSCF